MVSAGSDRDTRMKLMIKGTRHGSVVFLVVFPSPSKEEERQKW